MLALRALAAKEITPTTEEIAQAYEAKYGESVKVRIIVHADAAKARELQAAAAAHPKRGWLARQHSQDPSASLNGLIQPIRRHIGDKQLEQAAFSLPEGAVSQVIPLQMPGAQPGSPGAQQFAIIKCEGRLAAQNIAPEHRQQLEKTLRDSIVEKKLQKEATRIFSEIEKQAQAAQAIVNIYNDPKLRAQYPGVAAAVYQQQITLAQLSEECVKRHGPEVLDSVIYRRLLGQALKERNLTITDDDLETEIAHAAILMGKVDQNGRPDRKAWLHMVTVENGMNWTAYLEDSVWPSAALKKLCGQPEVTNEDLRKASKPTTALVSALERLCSTTCARRKKFGKWPARIRRSKSSANWPSNTRSKPRAARSRAKFRRSNATVASQRLKNKLLAQAR